MSNQPFEGDEMIGHAIKALMGRWMVSAIIETGTEYGATAIALRKFGLPTFTIEVDEGLFLDHYKNLLKSMVIPICGPSPQVLPELIRLYNRVLLYLDAHSMSGTVVKNELKVIAEYTHKPPVIVVHDVKVPGKDFGYDICTDGTELTFEYFSDLLPAIYPDGFDYRFNTEAYGARRGVVYITPKE